MGTQSVYKPTTHKRLDNLQNVYYQTKRNQLNKMELLPNDLIAIINRYLLCDKYAKVVCQYRDKWLNINVDDDDLRGSMRHETRWNNKDHCFSTYYERVANYRNTHPMSRGYNPRIFRFAKPFSTECVMVFVPKNY